MGGEQIVSREAQSDKYLGFAHFSDMMRAPYPPAPGGFVRSLAEIFR